MIAVDTSALMAVLLDEPEATACAEALATNDRIVTSAATMAEALIVAERRGLGAEMTELVDGLGLEIASVSPSAARRRYLRAVAALRQQQEGRAVHKGTIHF